VSTHFETVLRLFRFENQSAGDAFLRSHPPVYYVKGKHGHINSSLPMPTYKPRSHPQNVREGVLEAEFNASCLAALDRVGRTVGQEVSRGAAEVPFGALKIVGLECLKQHRYCLGIPLCVCVCVYA